jgi:hypothetical protein
MVVRAASLDQVFGLVGLLQQAIQLPLLPL